MFSCGAHSGGQVFDNIMNAVLEITNVTGVGPDGNRGMHLSARSTAATKQPPSWVSPA